MSGAALLAAQERSRVSLLTARKGCGVRGARMLMPGACSDGALAGSLPNCSGGYWMKRLLLLVMIFLSTACAPAGPDLVIPGDSPDAPAVTITAEITDAQTGAAVRSDVLAIVEGDTQTVATGVTQFAVTVGNGADVTLVVEAPGYEPADLRIRPQIEEDATMQLPVQLQSLR